MSVSAVGPYQAVRLMKGEGTIDVNLSWRHAPPVNVVCLYQLTNDQVGTVQSFGPNPNFGNLHSPPFLRLRTGGLPTTLRGSAPELLQISLVHVAAIRSLVVFACVDEESKWGKVQGAAVNIGHPQQGNFDFQLGRGRFGLPRISRYFSRSCVLLTMEADDSGNLKLLPLGTYFKGLHEEIAAAFGMPLA